MPLHPVILIPDEPETWDAQLAEGERIKNDKQRWLKKTKPPKSEPFPPHADHWLLKRTEWELGMVALGACDRCYGTAFWEAPPGSGHWICSRCHPPVGTEVQMVTAWKTEAGPWKAATVKAGSAK